MAKAKVLPQYIAGFSASFGGFCLGASIGWSAPVDKMITDHGAYGFEVSATQFTWISSMVNLGSFFVCIPTGFMLNWIGRKPTMLSIIPLYMIGWLLMIFGQNVPMLYCGRFILGFSGGLFCVAGPMYTTEISTTQLRGTVGSFFQLLFVLGVLYSYIVGAYCSLLINNILCAILPLIFGLVFLFMPESPVYLMLKGRHEDATKALCWLRGDNYDAAAELKQITNNAKQDGAQLSLGAALLRPVALKGLSIAMLLLAFQQWTGINSILFYSTSIFDEVGTGLSSALSTIIVGTTMVVSTFVAVAIIDKTGRRLLLALSAFFMAVTTSLMGVYFHMKYQDETSVLELGWLPISSICVFIVFFSIGFGPVPWLVGAEVFSEDIKTVAGSIAGTFNWLAASMVTILFPILRESIGPAPTFWIFTGIAVIAFIYTLVFVPETKGKTISEIQQMLAGGKKVENPTNP